MRSTPGTSRTPRVTGSSPQAFFSQTWLKTPISYNRYPIFALKLGLCRRHQREHSGANEFADCKWRSGLPYFSAL